MAGKKKPAKTSDAPSINKGGAKGKGGNASHKGNKVPPKATTKPGDKPALSRKFTPPPPVKLDDGDPPPTTPPKPTPPKKCGDGSHSTQPIRYSNGQMDFSVSDLSSNGFGIPWGQTRSYANLLGPYNETPINGNNWFIAQIPSMIFSPSAEDITNIGIVQTASGTLWFNVISEDDEYEYVPAFYFKSTLSYVDDQYILMDEVGNQTIFDSSGTFLGIIDAGRNSTMASYTDGQLTSMEFASGDDSGAYTYTYFDSGPNAGQLESVCYSVNGMDFQRCTYAYYGNSDSRGNLNDLQSALVEQYDASTSTWFEISKTYYRYYAVATKPQITTVIMPSDPVDSEDYTIGFDFGVSYNLGFPNTIKLYFTDEEPVAGSYWDGVGSPIFIGISDSPTPEAQAMWLATVINGNLGGLQGQFSGPAVAPGDGTVIITDSNATNFPYNPSDSTPPSGVTFVINQVGQEPVDNVAFASGLKYVVGPEAYSRMVNNGITPETATDIQLSGYADYYFEYDGQSRVTFEMVNGGAQQYSFSYGTGPGGGGMNDWATKTVERLPDGNQNIVYCNGSQLVMLKIFAAGQEQWFEYYQYDDQGRVILKAESSAVASYDEFASTLVVLNPNYGLIHTYDYYDFPDEEGYAPGYEKNESVQQGTDGVPTLLSEVQYTTQTVGGNSIYPISAQILYQTAGVPEIMTLALPASPVDSEGGTNGFWFGAHSGVTVGIFFDEGSSDGSFMTDYWGVDVAYIIGFEGSPSVEAMAAQLVALLQANPTIFSGPFSASGGTVQITDANSDNFPYTPTWNDWGGTFTEVQAGVSGVAAETSYEYEYYSGTLQPQLTTATLPEVPTDQNGSGTANSSQQYFDEFGRVTWAMDERGFITNTTYDDTTGAITQLIQDVDTEIVSGAPAGWSTPEDGGLNLVTDYEFDLQGRITQELGPSHEVDLGGTATTIRTAQWTVYRDDIDQTWTAMGYATGDDDDYTYTLLNPVTITQVDQAGRVTDTIQAIRSSTSGALSPSDSFPPPPPSPPPTPPSSSLYTDILGWWSLDETSGARADATGNGYTLADNNSVGSTTGKVYANAALFTAASSMSLTNASVVVAEGRGEFTAAFWMKPADVTDQNFPSGQSVSDNSGLSFTTFLYGGQMYVVAYINGIRIQIGSPTELVADTWYFVCYRYTGSSVILQVNNEAYSAEIGNEQAASGPVNTPAGSPPFAIGADWGGSYFYGGAINAYGAWTRALTDAECGELYNGGNGLALYAPPPPASLYTDILAWWSLDETSGTRGDSTGNGYALADNNSVDSTTGKVYDYAASFDGSNYLNNTSFDFDGLSAFTIAAWVNFSSLASYPGIVTDRSASNWNEFLFYNNDTSSISANVNSGALQLDDTNTSISIGVWYFICLTWDGTTLSLSVNNQTAATTALSGSFSVSGNGVAVGSRNGLAELAGFSGLMNAVGIWSRALTSSEITALYNGGNGLALYQPSIWTRWSHTIYDNQSRLVAQQDYFLIPEYGTGAQGVNYNQTNYGYDVMGRRNRVETPGGTITWTVYQPCGCGCESLVLEKWVGTDDTGATANDPSGSGASGNNMARILSNEYDGGESGGDENLTQQTLYQDSSTTRVTTYGYDFRKRKIYTDGEIDFYEAYTYDNQDRLIQTQRYDTTAEGNLIAQNATAYDPLGRVYQTTVYAVDPTTGDVGNSLVSNSWYDPSGNLVKQLKAGSSLTQKTVYDGISRPTIQYSSYNTSETGYPYPISVSGDTVMQQVESAYDDASNLISQTTRARFHNATGTGALLLPSGTQPQARVSYAAMYPDSINRQVAVANYGTYGASSWSRSDTIPTGSATILVNQTVYNSRGEAYQVIDPQGTVNQSTFDDAGRIIQLLENYISGGAGVDENRETDYAYNADSKIATLTAVNSLTGDQVTQFIYGTSLPGSDVASNELLATKIYPDDTGDAPDRITYCYNRLGQQKLQTDQNGTVREWDYDLLGRLQYDRVTTVGSGVDDTVLLIARSYEARGMLQEVTSYDNATVGSGSVVNDVLLAYNNFMQLETDYQSHSGLVDTSTTPNVQYGYADGSANTIRPASLTYPSGREINYDYSTSGSMPDLLSRIDTIAEESDTRAAYTYLGLATIVQIADDEPGIEMTYIAQGAEPVGDAGDQYTGLDRFGRLVDSRWIYSGSDINRVEYGYTQASNKQWRQNIVAGTGQDEYYTYDGLYQLDDLQRGTLNDDNTGISGTPTWEEDFTYDPLGNWTNYSTDGTSTLDQDRTQNIVNETTSISGSSSLVGYDGVGNMNITPQPADPDWSSAYQLTYDAWNRVVLVMDGDTTVAGYAYDGLNRRITKVTTSDTRDYYYSAQWQILEERVDERSDADRQFIWGLQGIDDLIFRDWFSGSPERLYAMGDGMSVTAVCGTDGIVLERYGYDAFGNANFMDADFNLEDGSLYDWETLYCGYRYDDETGFYQVRNRYLHPSLGRWLSRDPIGEMGGINLYMYVRNNPGNLADVYGLEEGSLLSQIKGAVDGLTACAGIPKAAIECKDKISQEDLKQITSQWNATWNFMTNAGEFENEYQTNLQNNLDETRDLFVAFAIDPHSTGGAYGMGQFVPLMRPYVAWNDLYKAHQDQFDKIKAFLDSEKCCQDLVEKMKDCFDLLKKIALLAE